MPRSDLIRLRKQEISGKIPSGEKKGPTKEKIRKSVCSILSSKNLPHKFNFRQSLFMDHEGTYALKPRQYRGDVVFWKNNNKKRIFKRGEKVEYSISKRLNSTRSRQLVKQAAAELDDQTLEAFSRYCSTEGIDLDFKNHFEYERSGIRIMDVSKGKIAFVYIVPMGFAMHDIRQGYTERWYPFPNPPEVGVFVENGKDGISISDIQVNGDFNYLHFKSEKDKPRTFCSRGGKDKLSKGNWQERTVNTIMYGVNTLYNGMNRESLLEHASETNLGERYHPPLSKRKWITEKKVEELGLLKRNIHPIIPATR